MWPQAVIFDFDGLILDTESVEVESWEIIFGRHGQVYPEWYWTYTLGRGADQIEQAPADLLREAGVVFDEDSLIAERTSLLFEMLQKLKPLPGVIDRIEEASSLGLPLAVASSSKHDWVDAHLERLGLLDKFNSIVCADDVPRAKPFPDLYLRACETLGTSPSEAIAFEDSGNGIAAAKQAGIYTVVVPNRISLHVDLSAADLRVDSLAHLTIAGLSRPGISRRSS